MTDTANERATLADASVHADWAAQWLRGPLPLCTLQIIHEIGPVHGYGITRALHEAGLGDIGGGTLYPLLARLERDELVTTEWHTGTGGPAKKTYTVTESGLAHLRAEAARWASFARITVTLVTSDERNRP